MKIKANLFKFIIFNLYIHQCQKSDKNILFSFQLFFKLEDGGKRGGGHYIYKKILVHILKKLPKYINFLLIYILK